MIYCEQKQTGSLIIPSRVYSAIWYNKQCLILGNKHPYYDITS